MIKQNNSACAAGKNQPRAKSKFLTHGQLSLGVSRVVPRLILIPLVCAAMFSTATSRTWAAASSPPVPYKDSYVLHEVSNVDNPDGSRDQVYAGVGTNSHSGSFTVIVEAHIEPTEYDSVSNSYVIPFTGSETVTVANGDSLFSTTTGAEVIPLPPSPPYGLGGSQTITGGTGRFTGATGSLTFTGLDLNNGTISISTTGTISTVGSSKTSN
jgi:hypothetical protein